MGSLGHAATMLGLCSLLTVTYVEGDSVLQKPTLDGPNVSLVGAIEVFRCIVSGASQTILYELHKENTGRTFGEYTGYYGLPAEFTLQVQVNHEGNFLCRASVQNVSSIPAADSLPQYFRVIEPVEGAELVSDPPSAEVTAGRGLTLTCVTRKGTHVSYRWSHNGTQIQASNPKASGNRLRVAEAAPEDAGKYSCLATNGLNDTLVYSASNHTFIRVKVPVSKPRISMAVHKERDVHWATVTCQSATGTPPVSFTFTLPNGTQILQREDALHAFFTIPIALNQSQGEVRCQAANGGLPVHSDALPLEVVPVGGAVTLTAKRVSHFFEPAAFVLRCAAERGTFPRFHWFLNDSRLDAERDVSPGPTLELRPVKLSGFYHCAVADSFDDTNSVSSGRRFIQGPSHVSPVVSAVMLSCMLFLLCLLAACCVHGVASRGRLSSSKSR
ncbi:basement membrane-specific heparan sulfate proteoglycan core protein isoform X2 [Conger conger]|uniref:basement membrane-specific heparan sulfate proteoglycan core protein isoform X2 n=1 Tax=Conger conger TaxID=82655 RepID=UPI002A5AE4AA|nr:basement membrane-specific heparan sulfate proteoglycan core protein isoform X2 [Conger conger]